MPAGHQVMQRPHPTQPEDPNWSVHAASLWVSHCRYRAPVEVRTAPPCSREYSIEKQESHTRCRSSTSPDRSLTSSTDVQKQVGQTIVQFVQARQRSATSFHRGLAALVYSRSRRSSVRIVRPIRATAPATTASAAAKSVGVAGAGASSARSSSPAGVPVSTRNRWGSSSSVSVRSAPGPGFGPVPIEAQKHVPAGLAQVTAIRKERDLRAA